MDPPSLFILASSVCKSLQCLISTLTQGGEGGSLFRLTCSVVQWRGRDTANQYHWHVWGVPAVDGQHLTYHSPRQLLLPGFTLLRLQGALQGQCPKWALGFVHFPGLGCSGSQVLCHGTDPDVLCVLLPSQVQATQATGCLVSALSQVGYVSDAQPWSQLLGFLCGHKVTVPGVLCVSSGKLISDCDTASYMNYPGS